MTGFYDLMHLLVAVIDRIGPLRSLRIATLSYNTRNLHELSRLIRDKKVERLSLVTSCFFRDHNRDLWDRTLTDFAAYDPAPRVAAARSHAKVVTMETLSGVYYSLEGSANLRTNRNREQFALFCDRTLHDWHAHWIDEMVETHGAQEAN